MQEDFHKKQAFMQSYKWLQITNALQNLKKGKKLELAWIHKLNSMLIYPVFLTKKQTNTLLVKSLDTLD